MMEAMTQKEPGDLGEVAMDVAAQMLGQGKGGGATGERPSILAHVDNQGVVDNCNHISHRSKGLRRVTRIVAHMRSLAEHDVVERVRARCDKRGQGRQRAEAAAAAATAVEDATAEAGRGKEDEMAELEAQGVGGVGWHLSTHAARMRG